MASELVNLLGEIAAFALATALTYAIRRLKAEMRKTDEERDKRIISEEQGDRIIGKAVNLLDEVSARFPDNHAVTVAKKKVRKLKEDFWDDEEATTDDLDELLKGW